MQEAKTSPEPGSNQRPADYRCREHYSLSLFQLSYPEDICFESCAVIIRLAGILVAVHAALVYMNPLAGGPPCTPSIQFMDTNYASPLRRAARDCSDRGLHFASKWCVEHADHNVVSHSNALTGLLNYFCPSQLNSAEAKGGTQAWQWSLHPNSTSRKTKQTS